MANIVYGHHDMASFIDFVDRFIIIRFVWINKKKKRSTRIWYIRQVYE